MTISTYRTFTRFSAIILIAACSSGALLWGGAPAAKAVRRLQREVLRGLERRAIADRYAEFKTFAADRLAASAGTNTFKDKTGNCRLSWFDRALRDPLRAARETEEFTAALHAQILRAPGDARPALLAAAEKIDAQIEPVQPPSGASGAASAADAFSNAVAWLAAAVAAAQTDIAAALAPLSPAERDFLRSALYPQSTGNDEPGHRFADERAGRRVCDLLEALDRRALLRAAWSLAALTDPAAQQRWADLAAAPASQTVAGVSGAIAAWIATPAGAIVVGGPDANEYRLDELTNCYAVVDPAGNDVYWEGSLSAARPVLVVVDLAGNDRYSGKAVGIQGGAVLGVSLLIDRQGDDAYEAGDVAQGSALGGVGILIDAAGNDRYTADRRAQGQAIGGVGLLIDGAGDDVYRAALLAQGVGGPLGFGLLDDLAGNDTYYAGGKYPSPYDDSPGHGGWSQGVGVGPRGVANGGIGVLLDGGGDDVCEADYFSHGGGYWFALGVARDFGGNDQRLGATRAAWDGAPRQPARFLRWGLGYGCHYALGFIFDDAGDDVYSGDHGCVAYAWDVAAGMIVDAAGNDRYTATSSGLGQAYNAGLAALFDGGGNDMYRGAAPGFAGATVDYHPGQKAGGNFAFLIDLAGADDYGPAFTNRTETVRGWAGGFLIDR
jgi:hypothetical protein